MPNMSGLSQKIAEGFKQTVKNALAAGDWTDLVRVGFSEEMATALAEAGSVDAYIDNKVSEERERVRADAITEETNR